MDELEWRRIDAGADAEARERGIDELIELIGAVDAIVRTQAAVGRPTILSRRAAGN